MAALTRAFMRAKATSGENFDALQPARYIDFRVLAASTAETITHPTGALRAVIVPNADVYVNNQGATAAVPAADITDGTGPIYIPAGTARPFEVVAAGTLSIISASAAIVAIEYFA